MNEAALSYIDDTVDRLRVQVDDIDVQDSIDLAAAERSQQRDTLYVIPGDVVGGPNEDNDGGVIQQLAVSIICLIAVTNRRQRGSGARDELVRREGQLKLALVGWTPAGMQDPLRYGRGSLVGFFAGTAWWQTEFHTALWINQ